jgi:hypothetical protein
MADVLQAIILMESSGVGLRVARVKDRANRLTSMKWMDIMVNVFVTMVDGVHEHVCEIQIVHSKMLLARTSLGGHKPYAQLRAANEILVVRGEGGSESGTAALEMLAKKQEGCVASKDFHGADEIQKDIHKIEAIQRRRRGTVADLRKQRKELEGARAAHDHAGLGPRRRTMEKKQAEVDADDARAIAYDAQVAADGAATALPGWEDKSQPPWHQADTCELCPPPADGRKATPFSKMPFSADGRHWCHICGRAVCKYCAPEPKIKLRGVKKPLRVCGPCKRTKDRAELRAEDADKEATLAEAKIESRAGDVPAQCGVAQQHELHSGGDGGDSDDSGGGGGGAGAAAGNPFSPQNYEPTVPQDQQAFVRKSSGRNLLQQKQEQDPVLRSRRSLEISEFESGAYAQRIADLKAEKQAAAGNAASGDDGAGPRKSSASRAELEVNLH